MEVDLEQQVAELLLEVGHGADSRPSSRVRRHRRAGRVHRGHGVDGLEHLVGLLQQVAAQRARGSGAGPTGTARAGCGPARRAPPARRPPAPPAGAPTATSGGRARASGRGPPTPPRPTCSSGRPRWWRSVTGPSGAASTDSFTSERTWRLQHWATSSGPRSPAASTAKRSASTRRTPASTGSTPSRAKARSRKETDGWTTTVTSPERHPRVAGQQHHRALGHRRATRARRRRPARRPGRRPPGRPRWPGRRPRRCRPTRSGGRRSGRRRTPAAAGWRPVRRKTWGASASSARVPAVIRSGPAGPRPTTSMRAAAGHGGSARGRGGGRRAGRRTSRRSSRSSRWPDVDPESTGPTGGGQVDRRSAGGSAAQATAAARSGRRSTCRTAG